MVVDSSYQKHVNLEMKKYIDSLKVMFDAEMGVVIGHTAEMLTTEMPQSTLSNLLTDIMFEAGNDLSLRTDGVPADFALLNFGGIRADLPAGDITIGDIYTISPFANYLVIVEMKGTDVKRMFEKFTDKINQPIANAKIRYQGGKVASVEVAGKPIINDKIYRLATIDFVSGGGDNILVGCNTKLAINTTTILRDLIIDYIKKHKNIKGKIDDRAIIE